MLLRAVALMIAVFVWRIQDVILPLGKIKIGVLSALLAAVFLIANRDSRRLIGLSRSPILQLAGIILVLMVLGIPTSLWSGKSLSFVMRDFAPTILLMVVIAASVRDLRDLEWLVFVTAFGGILYSLFVFVSFKPGPDGRLGDLVFYDANDFALLLCCTLPLAIFVARNAPRRWWRVAAMFGLPLLLLMLIKSGSRGGFLALLAVSAFILFRSRDIPRRVRVGVVAGGALLLTLFASDQYWENMSTLLNPTEDYNWSGQAEVGRMEIWKRGLGYMAKRPVFGVGARAFPQAEGMLSEAGRLAAQRGEGFKWSAAHNAFIEIGAEVGPLALLLFLCLLGATFKTLWRIASLPARGVPLTPTATALARGLMAAMIGYVVAAFFLSAAYMSFLYVLLGMVAGLWKLVTIGAAAPADGVPAEVAARRPLHGWRTYRPGSPSPRLGYGREAL